MLKAKIMNVKAENVALKYAFDDPNPLRFQIARPNAVLSVCKSKLGLRKSSTPLGLRSKMWNNRLPMPVDSALRIEKGATRFIVKYPYQNL